MLYWHGLGKRKDGRIFKTIPEMQKETGLSRNNQDTAIAILVEMGVLEVVLKGVPAKRHFKLDLERLAEIIPSLSESIKLPCLIPPRHVTGKQQAITKINPKNTTKSTAITHANFQKQRNALIYKFSPP